MYSSMSNTRTAGGAQPEYKTVQAWKTKKSIASEKINPAQQQILSNLEKASQGKIGIFDSQLDTQMAYADSGQHLENTDDKSSSESYQFKDIIDIINPLHHLPIISTAYRGLTNDTIHPMSQIIGGALYGGPVGAVTGTVNAISQMKTGKDLGDHALSLIGLGKKDIAPTLDKNNPEQQLNHVAKMIKNNASLDALPGTTMAFVNLSEPQKAYEYTRVAEGRTAGRMMTKHVTVPDPYNKEGIPEKNIVSNLSALSTKEEMTLITMSVMPPRRTILNS